jgi:hypothetical protein
LARVNKIDSFINYLNFDYEPKGYKVFSNQI